MVAESIAIVPKRKPATSASGAREVLKAHVAHELVFAVVGHVGSGTSTVAKKLKELLEDPHLSGGSFDVEILKARQIIVGWARERGAQMEEPQSPNLEYARWLQDQGDAMREHDHSAVASALCQRIRRLRAEKQKTEVSPGLAIRPDGTRRAYIIDAIRHPAEAYLLRSIYRNAFALIGVVCDGDIRSRRLSEKYRDGGKMKVEEFMERDAKAQEKHGQRVSDAFHLADYFLDNSADRFLKNKPLSNEDWSIPRELTRLIRIITHSQIERPYTHETAMYAAYGAQMRSACLSRQVGAALVDKEGNIIATGANEVPRAGGGVYGQGFHTASDPDYRCAFRPTEGEPHFCSNTREQNQIIDELLMRINKYVPVVKEGQRAMLREELRRSRIGGLLEFSRAVHAEMDALMSAARKGISTTGCRLFVTTFPCHYCARHIVVSGVDEVQYIEPYPKSKALELHSDSIAISAQGWTPPSTPVEGVAGKTEGHEKRVLFRPFTGVAPIMYARAFLKDRDLKDNTTGEMLLNSEPDWGTAWDISKGSYVELEARLSERAEASNG